MLLLLLLCLTLQKNYEGEMHRLSLRNSERYRHVKIKTNGHVYFKEISCTAVDLAADIGCKPPKLLRYCRYCSRDECHRRYCSRDSGEQMSRHQIFNKIYSS